MDEVYGMKPGDILEYRCPTMGIVWQWRVLSICHGGDRQECLIEVKPIMAGSGFAHGKMQETVWVPEPMTRSLALIGAAP
jgi:hypothetical protein